MVTKKITTLITACLLGATLIGSVALADTAVHNMSLSITDSGSAKIKGTVVSVNATASTMAISSWGGTWTVNAAQATLKSTNGTTITLSNITAGEVVTVSGTASQSATLITATSIMVQNPVTTNTRSIVGTIANLNASAGTFTVNPAFILFGNQTGVNVATDSSTSVNLNGNSSTLTSLQNGNSVLVTGSWDATSNLLTADTVKASTKSTGSGFGVGLLEKIGLKFGFGSHDKN